MTNTPSYFSLFARSLAQSYLIEHEKDSAAAGIFKGSMRTARRNKLNAIVAVVEQINATRNHPTNTKRLVRFMSKFMYRELTFSPSAQRSMYLCAKAQSYEEMYMALRGGFPGLCVSPTSETRYKKTGL